MNWLMLQSLFSFPAMANGF